MPSKHYIKSKQQHRRRGSKRAISTEAIVKALLATNNDRSKAARLIGCTDATIRRRIAIDKLQAPTPNTLIDANLIQTAITKHEGNIRLVASELQMSVSSLSRRLARNQGLKQHLRLSRRKKFETAKHKNTGVQTTPWNLDKPDHTHMFGAHTEHIFSAACIQHGYIPCKPEVDNLVYDMVVKGTSGKYYEVQIKGRSRYNNKGASTRSTVSCSFMDAWVLNKDLNDLTPSQYTGLDVFAYYCAPDDIWYLIPVDKITSRSVSIRPNGRGIGKYEQYKNNWSIFE